MTPDEVIEGLQAGWTLNELLELAGLEVPAPEQDWSWVS